VEYTALFIWLTLCLVLGGLISYVMAGARTHRAVQFLAAPGMVIRKFSMTVTALLCGASITRVRVYELSSEDIDFQAEGISSIAKVLAPLSPLFGCAVVMTAVNAAFGDPLRLECAPPALASLDSGGLKGFLAGTWALLDTGVRQGLKANWHSANLYVLFALIFSLALGASAPMRRVREAILGAGLLAVSLALLSSISVRRAGVVAATPTWFGSVRGFVVNRSGVAFMMMVYGMFAALVVGLVVRLYELTTRTSQRRSAKSTPLPGDEEWKRAA
jgi:hypothetical protein